MQQLGRTITFSVVVWYSQVKSRCVGWRFRHLLSFVVVCANDLYMPPPPSFRTLSFHHFASRRQLDLPAVLEIYSSNQLRNWNQIRRISRVSASTTNGTNDDGDDDVSFSVKLCFRLFCLIWRGRSSYAFRTLPALPSVSFPFFFNCRTRTFSSFLCRIDDLITNPSASCTGPYYTRLFDSLAILRRQTLFVRFDAIRSVVICISDSRNLQLHSTIFFHLLTLPLSLVLWHCLPKYLVDNVAISIDSHIAFVSLLSLHSFFLSLFFFYFFFFCCFIRSLATLYSAFLVQIWSQFDLHFASQPKIELLMKNSHSM